MWVEGPRSLGWMQSYGQHFLQLRGSSTKRAQEGNPDSRCQNGAAPAHAVALLLCSVRRSDVSP